MYRLHFTYTIKSWLKKHTYKAHSTYTIQSSCFYTYTYIQFMW
jgi:hypothetical protein